MKKVFKEKINSGKLVSIYRIFIEHKGKEYTYVGQSSNINNQFNIHRSHIEKFLGKDIQLVIDSFSNKTFPLGDALYYKIILFLMINNHDITDIKFELLESGLENNQNKLEEIELKYILKFKAEKYGFNGPFAKMFALENAILENNKEMISQYQVQWQKQEKRIVKDYAIHDQAHIGRRSIPNAFWNTYTLILLGYIKDQENWFKEQWTNIMEKVVFKLEELE